MKATYMTPDYSFVQEKIDELTKQKEVAKKDRDNFLICKITDQQANLCKLMEAFPTPKYSAAEEIDELRTYLEKLIVDTRDEIAATLLDHRDRILTAVPNDMRLDQMGYARVSEDLFTWRETTIVYQTVTIQLCQVLLQGIIGYANQNSHGTPTIEDVSEAYRDLREYAGTELRRSFSTSTSISHNTYSHLRGEALAKFLDDFNPLGLAFRFRVQSRDADGDLRDYVRDDIDPANQDKAWVQFGMNTAISDETMKAVRDILEKEYPQFIQSKWKSNRSNSIFEITDQTVEKGVIQVVLTELRPYRINGSQFITTGYTRSVALPALIKNYTRIEE